MLVRTPTVFAAVVPGLVAAVVVIAIYWPSLGNGLIWDDHSYITFSPVLHDPDQWLDAVFRPLTGDAVFRPLTLLTFVLHAWAGQTSPAAYHAVNLVIHGVNVFLVAFLVRIHAGRNWGNIGGIVAAAIGLVYGLHPAISESALWIACRFDLLMTLFLFLALCVDGTEQDRNWGRALGTGALFLAALLSKETAIGFIVALPLVHLATDRTLEGPIGTGAVLQVWRARYRVYLALLIACVIYLLLRLAALGPALGGARVMQRFDEIGSTLQHLYVVAASLIYYVSDVLRLTDHLVPNRTLPLPVSDGLGIFAILAIASAAALLVLAAWKSAAARAPCLMLLAFLAAMLPLSNVLPAPTYSDELQIASRYLTFPLIFICLAMAFGLARCARVQAGRVRIPSIAWFALGLWIAGSALTARAITPKWHDEGVFFRWAIENSGETAWPYLYMNLGAYYIGQGDMAQGRDTFERGTGLRHQSPRLVSLIWYNLGNAEEKLGNAGHAMQSYDRALTLDPDNVFSRAGLGRLERSNGEIGKSVATLEEGLRRLSAQRRRHPYETLLHRQLGLSYHTLGQTDRAARELESARETARDPRLRAEIEEDLKTVSSAPPAASKP